MVPNRRVHFHRIGQYTLALNQLTGRAALLNSAERAVYDTCEHRTNDGSAPVLRLLSEKLIFVDEAARSDLEGQFRQACALLEARRPYSFTLVTNYRCNLQCTYCYEGRLTENTAKMSEAHVDAAFEAIDAITHTCKPRLHRVDLFGGEPLLPHNRPLILRFLAKAAERQLVAVILTNGVFVQDFIPALKQLGPRLRVQVTLDGIQPVHDQRRRTADGHGSFAAVVAAIDSLLDAAVLTTVRVNLDRENTTHLGLLIDFILQKTWHQSDCFRLNLCRTTDNTIHVTREPVRPLSQWEILCAIEECLGPNHALLPRTRINVGRMADVLRGPLGTIAVKQRAMMPKFCNSEESNLKHLMFDPSGLIYPCAETLGSENYAVGRYWPFFAWHNEQASKWRKSFSIYDVQPCVTCDIAAFCGGVSPLMAITGGTELHCTEERELLDRYIEAHKEEIVKLLAV